MRSLLAFLTLLFCLHVAAQTQSRLIPKKGLFVTTHGLTWATGSEINVFTANKKQHHYYFTWWEQDADSTLKGRDVLHIGSSNTAVEGTYTLQQTNTKTEVRISCNWNRSDTGLTDLVHTRLWLPYLHAAKWYINGVQLTPQQLTAFYDKELELHTPFGNFHFEASSPFRIRRDEHPQPGPQDYEKRSQYLLFYEQNIPLMPAGKLERSFTVTEIASTAFGSSADSTLPAEPVALQAAWTPDMPTPMILPLPKQYEKRDAYYFFPETGPVLIPRATTAFRELLRLQWQIGNQYYPNITSQQNINLAPEGYSIAVNNTGIRIEYQSQQALQYALHTLLQLTVPQQGRLAVPHCNIIDAPAISWRGIHMFTGPQSWPLHRRMYEQVLLPLKMNKVVLQCEQAEWTSFPNIHNKISVPLADLKAEFDYLRMQKVQPIPLIQSLGHMEWFFKPQENRKLAVNPLYPYTLNAELSAARKAVKKIWNEAFRLLQPEIMHIGFDEIGMIGFHLPREKEVDLWKTQINFLNRYAQKKKVPLMLWGDMGLGPGEGPDALNGITRERAALLRNTIPKGSYIADWHYISNPDPEIYKPNLRIWKENRIIPLAAPWLRPNNVRGFVLAAKEEGAGVLQTTWADFESSEANMLLNIEQFGAYILALDYAWSGRTELPEGLPYNYVEEWTSRFYSQPKPITIRNGWQLQVPVAFADHTNPAGKTAPTTVLLPFEAKNISGFRLRAATQQIVSEGTPVAQVQGLRNGAVVFETTIRYGAEIRGRQDARPIFTRIPGKDATTFYQFFEKSEVIDSIRIQLLHAGSGLQVEELILIE